MTNPLAIAARPRNKTRLIHTVAYEMRCVHVYITTYNTYTPYDKPRWQMLLGHEIKQD